MAGEVVVVVKAGGDEVRSKVELKVESEWLEKRVIEKIFFLYYFSLVFLVNNHIIRIKPFVMIFKNIINSQKY